MNIKLWDLCESSIVYILFNTFQWVYIETLGIMITDNDETNYKLSTKDTNTKVYT